MSETVEPLRVFSSGVLSFPPPTYTVRNTSLEVSSALETVVGDGGQSALRRWPSVVHTDSDCSHVDTISIPGPRTQESAADSFDAPGVGQTPPITPLVNHDHTDTILHPLKDPLPQYTPICKLSADGISTQVPTQSYDKPRRVLPLATKPSMLNVSMRGSFDIIDILPLRFVYTYSYCLVLSTISSDISTLWRHRNCQIR
jgi:hypothetical protein